MSLSFKSSYQGYWILYGIVQCKIEILIVLEKVIFSVEQSYCKTNQKQLHALIALKIFLLTFYRASSSSTKIHVIMLQILKNKTKKIQNRNLKSKIRNFIYIKDYFCPFLCRKLFHLFQDERNLFLFPSSQYIGLHKNDLIEHVNIRFI